MKRILFFLIVPWITACGQTIRYSYQPPVVRGGTSAEVLKVYGELQEFGELGTQTPRDTKYYPQNILPRIHPWLSAGKGLRWEKMDGHWALMLDSLPPAIAADLEKITFLSNFNSGFAILQFDFWQRVRGLIANGTKVGFIYPSPDFLVAGVFFSARNTILVDIFGNSGVLIHESRHQFQHQHRSPRGYPSWLTLNRECLDGLTVFFGELDATTVELRTWSGVFKTLNTTPDWHLKATDGMDPIRFPQNDMLAANLNYPGKSYFENVREAGCPFEVKAGIRKIVDETDRTAIRIKDLGGNLTSLRMLHFFDSVQLNTECPRQTRECIRVKKERDGVGKKSDEIKVKIETEILNEARLRPVRIREALSEFSQSIQQDLCWYASGYEFLQECQRFFK